MRKFAETKAKYENSNKILFWHCFKVSRLRLYPQFLLLLPFLTCSAAAQLLSHSISQNLDALQLVCKLSSRGEFPFLFFFFFWIFLYFRVIEISNCKWCIGNALLALGFRSMLGFRENCLQQKKTQFFENLLLHFYHFNF